jgi:polyhydroxybutyrate depolymerase
MLNIHCRHFDVHFIARAIAGILLFAHSPFDFGSVIVAMNNNRSIVSVAISLSILSLSLMMGSGLLSHAQEPESTSRLASGDHTRNLRFEDRDRRYLIHIPKSYAASKPTPVVLVFHGGGGNPDGMIKLCGMNSKSDQAGFIVVYPFGTGRLDDSLLSFNGGECCGYAMQNTVDDVGFTRALLDDLASVVHVDQDRVFATGLSNGGIMSHYLASELSDRIAAIAPVGGPLMMETPRNKRPVPVMHFHGTKDEFAPYEGGYGKGFLGRNGITSFRSVEHTVQSWVKANGCVPVAKVIALPDKAKDGMRVKQHTWSGGKHGSEVVLVEIVGGGHTWPGQTPILPRFGDSTTDISANDLMWDFFQRHPRSKGRDQSTKD